MIEIDELVRVYETDRSQPEDGPSMTMIRVWSFLTGWDQKRLREDWRKFLDWPPDVFALCIAILKRSGAYTLVLDGLPRSESRLRSATDIRATLATWQEYLRQCHAPNVADPPNPSFPTSRGRITSDLIFESLPAMWDKIWLCRHVPLFQISGYPQLIDVLIEMVALADEASKGSGLPLRRGSDPALYPVIRKGWEWLEPTKYGSSLCSSRIHPGAARVLPKMHTPRSGLTARSFSHHLAFCETDEIQPRWFMIPGGRGNVRETDHINLLVLPWPTTLAPSQIYKSKSGGRPLREQGEKGLYFTYKMEGSERSIADDVDRLCEETQRFLGSVDGVVMPELALSMEDFEAVRERVLRRGLMLISGVGLEAEGECPGENRLCVDMPLSRYHAVHFRQEKHHRWRLDAGQIKTYNIGARLDPKNAYWENISIGDRRLLFLVLRPWLVTSVLICEDLARHDPVGELLRGVGPHLVVALLMDGPQLANRWPSRYAAALADDPGCSVLSVSSLGMVGLSKPNPNTKPSRVVALWKDAWEGTARELSIEEGATALALTISLKRETELTADGRRDADAAFPVLTGVHSIRLPAGRVPQRPENEAGVYFLAPHEAAALARLVQQDIAADPAPVLFSELTGEALAIAREIWRLKTKCPSDEEMAMCWEKPMDYSELPTKAQTETAKQILEWFKTNRDQE